MGESDSDRRRVTCFGPFGSQLSYRGALRQVITADLGMEAGVRCFCRFLYDICVGGPLAPVDNARRLELPKDTG